MAGSVRQIKLFDPRHLITSSEYPLRAHVSLGHTMVTLPWSCRNSRLY
jgi:hypothetical protein